MTARTKVLLVAGVVVGGTVTVNLIRAERDPLVGLQPMPDPTGSDFRAVETTRGTKIWPRSVPLIEGVQYRYSTGHCGLGFIADFDEAFWEPHVPEGEKVRHFMISEDEGTLVVLSHERAHYRSSDGHSVLLTRVDGPIVLEGACA